MIMNTEAVNNLKSLKNLLQLKGADQKPQKANTNDAFAKHLRDEHKPAQPAEQYKRAERQLPEQNEKERPETKRAERYERHDPTDGPKKRARETSDDEPRDDLTTKNQVEKAFDQSEDIKETSAEQTKQAEKTTKEEEAAETAEFQELTGGDYKTDEETSGLNPDTDLEAAATAKEALDQSETGPLPAAATDTHIKTKETTEGANGIQPGEDLKINEAKIKSQNQGPLHPLAKTKGQNTGLAATEGENLGANGDAAGQEKSQNERGISEIAKTLKEAPSQKDAALALAAQNKQTHAPILANSDMQGAGILKGNSFQPIKAEAGILTAGDSADGTAIQNQVIDGKSQAATNIQRPQGASGPTQTIAMTIAQKVQNGTQQFEIRLNPPELGRVDVRLEFGKDGQVTAHLIVERPETLEMLNKDARQLERTLQNAGVKLDDNGVSLSLKDQNQSGREQTANDQGPNRDGIDQNETETDLQEIEPGPLHRRIARATGLDISI